MAAIDPTTEYLQAFDASIKATDAEAAKAAQAQMKQLMDDHRHEIILGLAGLRNEAEKRASARVSSAAKGAEQKKAMKGLLAEGFRSFTIDSQLIALRIQLTHAKHEKKKELSDALQDWISGLEYMKLIKAADDEKDESKKVAAFQAAEEFRAKHAMEIIRFLEKEPTAFAHQAIRNEYGYHDDVRGQNSGYYNDFDYRSLFDDSAHYHHNERVDYGQSHPYIDYSHPSSLNVDSSGDHYWTGLVVGGVFGGAAIVFILVVFCIGLAFGMVTCWAYMQQRALEKGNDKDVYWKANEDENNSNL